MLGVALMLKNRFPGGDFFFLGCFGQFWTQKIKFSLIFDNFRPKPIFDSLRHYFLRFMADAGLFTSVGGEGSL